MKSIKSSRSHFFGGSLQAVSETLFNLNTTKSKMKTKY